MKKKILFLSLISTLLVGFATFTAIRRTNSLNAEGSVDAVPTDGNEYDYWCNSWSKPGHIYFHYNRGTKASSVADYDKFCLWVWNQTKDGDGTLWAYNGPKNPSPILELRGASDHWMYDSEVGLSDANIHLDNYGVIVDLDLNREDLVCGKILKEQVIPVDYKDCDELGFLFVEQSSMNGEHHWTSDGGRNNYIDDFTNEENWRDIDNKYGKGKTQHIFFSTGSLDEYSYYAGDGAPEIKINPIDSDTSGKYSSKTDATIGNYGVSKTSESFKELGVGYQIFVASFRDSNGDGLGDLRGIIDSLDYLQDLGVEVLWLTPIQQSDSYHGYDISDYYAVDKKFGTIDDYRELIYKAHKRGMKVLMDLVLNHTSKSNVWFTKSQWGVNSTIVPNAQKDTTGIDWRNVYNWKYKDDTIDKLDRRLEGNEWVFSNTYRQVKVIDDANDESGPSWYRDGESNYYYYGKFGSGMPELNYSSKDTRTLVENMAKYWLSFGLDGFRLDAVKHIFMRDEVDNPGDDTIIVDVGTKHAFDEEKGKNIDQAFDYSTDLTRNVSFWKEFANEIKSVYPNAFLVGENFDGYGTRTAPYYQGLDSQFDFSTYYHVPSYLYNHSGGASNFMTKQASESYDVFAGSGTYKVEGDYPCYVQGGKRPDFINGSFTSNHDVMRAINHANGVGNIDGTKDAEKITGTDQEIGRAKIQGAVSILNPGVSWIYYGDELGMSSNINQHSKYGGNNNNVDIWYRQPFMWKDSSVIPAYKSGKYVFEWDDYNSKLAANVSNRIDLINGNVTTGNDMYKFYKGLTTIKRLYPDAAQINFDESSDNVLVINVWGIGKSLKIYINVGKNNNEYRLNPGPSFNPQPVVEIGVSGASGSGTFNLSNWYSVVAFQSK